MGRTYNVGSEEALTIKELADLVDLIAGGSGVVLEGASAGAHDRYVPDTSRLSSELGFEPAVLLASAIARTAAWYRDAGVPRMPL